MPLIADRNGALTYRGSGVYGYCAHCGKPVENLEAVVFPSTTIISARCHGRQDRLVLHPDGTDFSYHDPDDGLLMLAFFLDASRNPKRPAPPKPQPPTTEDAAIAGTGRMIERPLKPDTEIKLKPRPIRVIE